MSFSVESRRSWHIGKSNSLEDRCFSADYLGSAISIVMMSVPTKNVPRCPPGSLFGDNPVGWASGQTGRPYARGKSLFGIRVVA